VEAPNAGIVGYGSGQPIGGATLTDVAVRSTDDAWAVGGGQGPLIEHWDGRAWSIVSSPAINLVNETLFAVAADAVDDAWAAGYGGLSGGIGPVIEHWDGRTWTVTPLPDIDTRYTTVADLVAVSPTDAWVVGQKWNEALVLHWDGHTWDEVDSPKVRSTRLSAVEAVAVDDVWAVGTSFADVDGNGPPQGILEHWDGSSWTLVTLPKLTPGTALGTVTAAAPDDVWVAGSATKRDGAIRLLLLHYDGSQWSVVETHQDAPVLRRIAADSEGQVWAIGTIHVDEGFRAFVARLCR
jgi:hypothetical protein